MSAPLMATEINMQVELTTLYATLMVKYMYITCMTITKTNDSNNSDLDYANSDNKETRGFLESFMK